MKAENIYKELKKLIYPIHAHNDQMIAIAHWVESKLKQRVAANLEAHLKDFCQTQEAWKIHQSKIGLQEGIEQYLKSVGYENRD